MYIKIPFALAALAVLSACGPLEYAPPVVVDQAPPDCRNVLERRTTSYPFMGAAFLSPGLAATSRPVILRTCADAPA